MEVSGESHVVAALLTREAVPQYPMNRRFMLPRANLGILKKSRKSLVLSTSQTPDFLFQTFAMFRMLYAFVWVIPWRLNFVCQHFRTHCLFYLRRRVGMKNSSYLPTYEDGTDRASEFYVPAFLNTLSVPSSYLPAYENGTDSVSEFYMFTFRNTLSVPSSYLPAYEDGTVCSEMPAYKIQTPGNYPEESTQQTPDCPT